MSERKAQPAASFAAAAISGKEAARGVRVSHGGLGDGRRMQISQTNGSDSSNLTLAEDAIVFIALDRDTR